ncbi:hypothetical protein [Caldovatus aquaticus]|uniref:Uncharacterized protein n=1 Tax=Caldovatus aquaticus TaxID=2865671 RepID=A0ABS7F607_9PROT|nr:hypothetical protein [Caldovatus aquaticus]MBW8271053.1 hypothetical protein [Caldovatus aquaticus]
MFPATWPNAEYRMHRAGGGARRPADDRAAPLPPGSGVCGRSPAPHDRHPARERGPEAGPEPLAVLESFVAGLAACAAPRTLATLRAGTELTLRRPDRAALRPGDGAGVVGPEIEVWTAEGQPLGRLPPEDAAVLDRLAAPGGPVRAQVSAVVPAFLRPRVQVRIAFAEVASAARSAPDGRSPGPR